MVLGTPFLECPRCGARASALERLGRRLFHCQACAQTFEVKAANEDDERASKSKR